jgi:hypothetical protein
MRKYFLTMYFQGGLGNQIFQFLTSYFLAKKNNMSLRFDLTFYNSSNRKFELNNFPEIKKIKFAKITKYKFYLKFLIFFFNKLFSLIKIKKDKNFFFLRKKLENSPFIFNKKIFKYKFLKDTSITGYYQSENYFKDKRKEVLNILKFPIPHNKLLNIYLKRIKESNSIAMHFRRGDYLLSKHKNYHGILPFDYYKKSLHFFNNKIKYPKFFIFSDDIKFIKKNFSLNKKNFFFINTKSSINDLHLMSKCKHHIIANSSFSWWGAWLSTYKKKIVCAPKQWVNANIVTKDILPKSWVKI